MPKRPRGDKRSDTPPAKRTKGPLTGRIDRLSSLSDELLLNILSYLPISSLNVCQRYGESFGTLIKWLLTFQADCHVGSTLLVETLNSGKDNTIHSGCALVPVDWRT